MSIFLSIVSIIIMAFMALMAYIYYNTCGSSRVIFVAMSIVSYNIILFLCNWNNSILFESGLFTASFIILAAITLFYGIGMVIEEAETMFSLYMFDKNNGKKQRFLYRKINVEEVVETFWIVLFIALPFIAMIGVFEGVFLIKMVSIIFLIFCLKIAIDHGSTMPIYWLILISSSLAFIIYALNFKKLNLVSVVMNIPL